MEMKKKKVYRLKYKVDLYKNGRRVQSTFSTKKTKIVRCSQVWTYENGLLKVMLDNRQNVINEAIFRNTAELKKALSAFTEKEQVDYIAGGEK